VDWEWFFSSLLGKNARCDAMARSEVYYDEVKSAANNLALVGLVTRFHHWVSKFVETLTAKSARDRSLAKNVGTLNEHLGAGPVPLIWYRRETRLFTLIHKESGHFRESQEELQPGTETCSLENFTSVTTTFNKQSRTQLGK
jgi:hypothetical protein